MPSPAPQKIPSYHKGNCSGTQGVAAISAGHQQGWDTGSRPRVDFTAKLCNGGTRAQGTMRVSRNRALSLSTSTSCRPTDHTCLLTHVHTRTPSLSSQASHKSALAGPGVSPAPGPEGLSPGPLQPTCPPVTPLLALIGQPGASPGAVPGISPELPSTCRAWQEASLLSGAELFLEPSWSESFETTPAMLLEMQGSQHVVDNRGSAAGGVQVKLVI